ncbi:cytochrome P450 [Ketobacter alkanivorans]|uniref:Cytochrome P450 n=1 Tax=Ketobacter alkanivorans TaxID=1917421 RepID=A0A2K9LLF6_9GAMM|nr:cytochrome P450 [Ketobacter alkanivorans]AUM13093.1 hypothetical protein Kalk_11945 [Ketobacter alkanivorans]
MNEPRLIAHSLPSSHLLWGNLKPFMADILGYLESTANFGPFIQFRLFNTRVYLVSDPELVNTVLTNKSQSFVRNRSFAKRLRRLFGHGLLTSEGDEWKRLRKLSAPAFQPKSTNTYIPIINDEVKKLAKDWDGCTQVDIAHEMSKITARIITRCIFGMELEVDMAEMEDTMDQLMSSLGPRLRYPIYTPDWLPVGGNVLYRKAVKRVDRFIYSGIQARLADNGEQQPSLLADLMAASGNDGDSRKSHLRDQIVTLFLAGHETTASTLTFAFILLSKHPQQFAKLCAEVRSCNLDAFDNLNAIRESLPVTYNIIREVMRLYPAGYIFGRTVINDTQLGAETLKKGSLVMVSPYVIHRNPDVFPNPEQFDPDRWLNLDVSRSQYLPFSAGARTCIGEYLAMLEACLILAGIVARFDVTCGTDPISIMPAITLRATNNTKATIAVGE